MTATKAPRERPAPRVRRVMSVPAVLVRISIAALIARALYFAMYAKDLKLGWDATWYTGIGDSIAAGRGYAVTCPVISVCKVRQTALFPPVLPLIFAAASKLGISSQLGREMLLGLIGAVTVYVVGQLGDRLGGRDVAFAAATIAAVNPMLILLEGALMTEELAALFGSLLLLLLVDQAREPRTWRWFGMGAITGIAALTRGEGPLWLLLVVGPSLFFLGALAFRARLRGVVLAVLTFAVVVSPWMIRNQHQFGHAYLGQPNLYGTLAATNCAAGYGGPNIGAWTCTGSGGEGFGDLERSGVNEATVYEQARHTAITYATHHVGRWPAVVLAREARAMSVIRPFHFQTGPSRFRSSVTIFNWALLIAAAIGIVLALRRKVLAWPLLFLIGTVLLTIAVTYGNPRYLAAAEPALAVFAGFTIAPLFRPSANARRAADAGSSRDDTGAATITPA